MVIFRVIGKIVGFANVVGISEKDRIVQIVAFGLRVEVFLAASIAMNQGIEAETRTII